MAGKKKTEQQLPKPEVVLQEEAVTNEVEVVVNTGVTRQGTESKDTGYYVPDLDDFRLGTVYMQKWAGNLNGAWRESMLEEQCYDMSLGHCEFMSIVANVKRTKGQFYRIKFLDSDDIEMLGFKKIRTGVYGLSNCQIVLDWSSKFNVRVFVDDEQIYRGRVLCFSELKWVLSTLEILRDESRGSKFEQLGQRL